MLGKLMKYEFKACGRVFFPLYIGILFLAIANGVSIGSSLKDEGGAMMDPNALNTQSILTLVLVALFVALFVITIVLTIQRFKKNLLDDEGYLMFTLPVKSSSLILSKFLVALIYAIISGIVAILSFTIIGLIGENISLKELIELFNVLSLQNIFVEGSEFIVYIILSMLVSYSIFVLTIYLALSVGQLPQLSKHRVAAGVILFFIINLIVSNIQHFVRSNLLGGVTEIELTNNVVVSSYAYLSVDLLISIVIGVVLFLLTNWILNKKLNLE
ncbi:MULTISPECIES: hypothetical protein [Terrisporobacter]|uniref:Uncharacterized protein n=1 Tax=Terrisporobacter othiniensis TaxID=1577792 RepID=A0A0B3VPB6_9FIRM|nr:MULTISPECIES: hypothetical protein [Terrisporobacter]KHS58631.1 hypothetical protein QX51_01620 [Terrisporobacter othiniensis]MCC3668834.1 ABC transporter permease [Terrisporobacter mayombei]